MKRYQLEHVIRASAAIVDVRDIVIIGSQAVLGSFPNAPDELTRSIEADVFPKTAPDRSILIEGSIGEFSTFHDTFGYFAHGVDETTATLPNGWRDRLVRVETPATMGAIGWCLEPHDLAVSKLAAGREKDISFVMALLQRGMIAPDILRQRLAETSRIHPERLKISLSLLDR